MRRSTMRGMRTSIILLILAVAMGGLGVGYAAWAGSMNWTFRATTGTMEMAFAPDAPFAVGVAAANGRLLSTVVDDSEISCIMDADGKSARLSVNSDLLLEELAQDGRMLVLQYRTQPSADSTIRSVTQYQPDFNRPSEETLEFSPARTAMTVDGKAYELPQSLGEMAPTLRWEVYRQTEEDGDVTVSTIYLKLSQGSLTALAGSPEITLDVEELPDALVDAITPEAGEVEGAFSARIDISYSFTLPIWIEQGR